MHKNVLTPHKKEYPMWVVSVKDVLDMTGAPRGHQQLLYDGILVKWRPSMDSVMVSHQWLGKEHPDRSGRHLRVLQQALRNVISGEVRVCSDIAYQFMGRNRTLSKHERKRLSNAYVWFDWWSIPQESLRSFCWIEDDRLERDQAAGIRSIPFYVSVSRFFICLVPPLRHEETDQICDYGTYLNRGWCRAELWCRYLASSVTMAEDDEEEATASAVSWKILPVIVVSAEDCVEFGSTETWRHCLAHEGEFTFEADRKAVGQICRAALDLKLIELEGPDGSPRDQDTFRVLAARREDLTGAQEKERTVEEFLKAFKFASLQTAVKVRRGIGGLACATLSGDLPMMRRLLTERASLMTRCREMFDVGIGPEFTPLHLAVIRSRHNTAALELLLEARSDPNMDAGPSSCALGWCPSGRAVEVMVEGRADVNRVSGPPFRITPLQTAAMTHQCREVFAMLLEKKADIHELGSGLRPPIMCELAVFCHLGYPDRLEVAKLLVNARADVNEKTKSRGMMYFLSLLARFRIRFPNPSVVVRVFADLDAASLGCAAIVGEAEMVRFLLSARADPAIKSARGVAQREMARSMEIRHAIDEHLQKLERGDDSDSIASDPSELSRLRAEREENFTIEMPF